MKRWRATRCRHRSHRKGWRCWREMTYDGYCGKHNTTCWDHCEGKS